MRAFARLIAMLKPPYGLRSVIMTGAAATILVCGVAYSLTAYMRLEESTLEGAKGWAVSVANLVSSSTTSSVILNDIAAMESSLQQVAKLPGIDYVAIFRSDGRELVGAIKQGTSVQSSVGSGARSAVPLDGVQAVPGSVHDGYYEAWAPIQTGRSYPSAWVQIHFSLNQRDRELRELWSRSLLGVLGLAGLLLLSLHLIISLALKPIRELSRFASDMPSHLGSQTVLSNFYVEVSQLGTALNEASLDLAQHVGRTRAIVNTASEAIIGLDSEGRVTTVNPTAISFFGQGELTLLGLPIEKFIPGLSVTALYDMFGDGNSNYFGMKRILRKDYEGVRADGTLFPVDISLGQVPDIDGLRYVCIIRDASDERAALAFTELYEQALDCSHNAVFITNAKQSSQPLVYVNSAFQIMLGLPLHEILGRSIEFLVQEQAQANDLAMLELRQAFVEQRQANVTLALQGAIGVQRIVECSLSPIVSGADEVTHFVGIAIDVTARVAAEEANAKRRAQLDAIFSLSPDGFVLFDANEQLVFANPAFERLTGGFLLSTDVGMDLRGFESGLLGLCGPEQTPVTFEFKPQEVRDTEEWQARLHLVRPQTRVLQAQARRTAQGRGETIFYFRDVTHEDAVDRMKSEFLAAAAHELRTPMVSIFGFTELLLRRKFTPERQADMLQTIHRQSGLLVKMINELLDLARIESRRGLDLQIEPHPLRELVEHSVKGLMLKDTDRQVIVRDVPPAVVLIDPEKMQLAMNNLLSNAFKYSPKGGDVAVAAFIDVLDGTHYAVIEVTDQGLGMSPEQLARAFDRFYRADASGNIPGTGLGLSMVREVASLHHGQIELDSVLGQGTTARLWIPLDAHHPWTHGIAALPPKESLGEVSILA